MGDKSPGDNWPDDSPPAEKSPGAPVVIYTDGGADPNPGIGGWAAVLRYGGTERVLTGNAPHTTNNRMELTAAISALRALTRPSRIELHTDSQYLRLGITQYIKNWQRRDWKTAAGKDVLNADLWQELWPLVRQHEIDWRWVEGHSGDALNERVDALAREARLAITPRETLDPNAPKLYLRATCRGNPGPGTWAAVLERGGDTTQRSGMVEKTTNNRMEIMAAIEGLRMLTPQSQVEVYTTSDYLFQGVTGWIEGWRRGNWVKRDGHPVANADLWKALDRLRNEYKIRWVNAKGQSHRGLEEAGKLAADAASYR